MKKLLFIMAVSALAAGCADNSIPKAQLPELDKSNPLLAAWDTPHETPPFSEIKLAHYEPAFDAAIACSRAEVEAIVKNPKKPTFGNTIVALERQGELLNRISGIFFNLMEADTSDEMQEIAQRVQPKLTELSNDISLDPELFARVKYPYNINCLAQEAVAERLAQDVSPQVARLCAERERLLPALAACPAIERVYPSDANFILVRTPRPDRMYDALIAAGVIVRNRSRIPGCEGCLRITVGTPAENARMLETVKNFRL